MEPIINIIIPCYYSSDIIRTSFNSLAIQTKKEHLRVYLVNDCSPNTNCEYSDIIEEFSQYFEIIYLKTPKNGGPGATRQFGLDNITDDSEYVMFIDDDDQLANKYVIQNFLNIIYHKEINQCIGFIGDSRKNPDGTLRYNHLTGSIFNRKILKLFNIRFCDWYCEEDTVFFMEYAYKLYRLSRIFGNNVFSREVITKFNPNFISYIYTINPISITHSFPEEKIIWNFFEMQIYSWEFLMAEPQDYITQELIESECEATYIGITSTYEYLKHKCDDPEHKAILSRAKKAIKQIIDTNLIIDENLSLDRVNYTPINQIIPTKNYQGDF